MSLSSFGWIWSQVGAAGWEWVASRFRVTVGIPRKEMQKLKCVSRDCKCEMYREEESSEAQLALSVCTLSLDGETENPCQPAKKWKAAAWACGPCRAVLGAYVAAMWSSCHVRHVISFKDFLLWPSASHVALHSYNGLVSAFPVSIVSISMREFDGHVISDVCGDE